MADDVGGDGEGKNSAQFPQTKATRWKRRVLSMAATQSQWEPRDGFSFTRPCLGTCLSPPTQQSAEKWTCLSPSAKNCHHNVSKHTNPSLYINITSQSPPPMCFICYGVTTLSQILPCVVTCPPTAQTSSTIVIREPVYRGDMRGQTGGEQDQNGDKDGYYIHRTSLHPPTSAHLYTKRYP